MKIPQKDRTTPRPLNTSTTQKPKRLRRRSTGIPVSWLILSGLLVGCVLSACLQDSQTTGEELDTKEAPITSQIPDNAQEPLEPTPETVIIETAVEAEIEETIPVQLTPVEPLYTDDELYCMAVVIYNEAGGNASTDEARELVGYVVLNRVNDPRFPDTIRGVLEQPGQYAGLGTNGVYFAPRASNSTEAQAIDRAYAIARKVLENRDNIPIPNNVVFQAEFVQGIGVYKQVGNTFFCYATEVN